MFQTNIENLFIVPQLISNECRISELIDNNKIYKYINNQHRYANILVV